MPSRSPSLSADDVHAYVAEHCFQPEPGARVGVELEWVSLPAEDPTAHLPIELLEEATAAAGPLPGGSRTTFEPGGQVEISSPPGDDVTAACAAAAGDASWLGRSLLPHGIALAAVGMDPLRLARRVVRSPRYDAMEAFFDADGTAGRSMMCSSAALQVNLDLGPPDRIARRWELAHVIGPPLAAAFANSPIVNGAPTGWRSSRLATWSAIDRSRTAPVDTHAHPADSYANYALNARVMLIRARGDRFVPELSGLTFSQWMAGGHELGYPTEDDLAYHLTTLFPPVRPRGWLEIRTIDVLPEAWWRVAVAVASALLYDDDAGERVLARATDATRMWQPAARHGVSHPALATAAKACFDAAFDAMPHAGVDAETVAAVATFYDRYVARGRCPADDLLDAWVDDPDAVVSSRLVAAWA